ncbi:MAG: COX15/CtaA family protein [Candidatus Kapaibacterium sp.]
MKRNHYQRWAFLTIIAVVFLIGVGSLVRASGAGLGCPDWPKCFGTWIPPMSVDELPPEFEKSQFNLIKTWTEYLNRLVGVLIGFFIFVAMLLSLQYRKEKPIVMWFSIAGFILVAFQGWLGSVVVATELTAWVITVHMVVALIILLLLMFAYYASFPEDATIYVPSKERQVILPLIIVLGIITIVQGVLGTQVREEIDIITKSFSELPREYWINTIRDKNLLHDIHRSFSWLPLILAVIIWWKAFSSAHIHKHYYSYSVAVVLLIVVQSAAGIILSYFAMPATMQVVHLTNFSLLFLAEVRLLQLTLKKV